ncbi:hypothetical protein C7M84_015640 [Penaeus vannamei]|uniref:Methyltransferase domain-containing protein n=1 Tax=Penaeus vannamei TaxID=6689 RepID=A0A423SQ58_PENVA|nr:hypothetical protein C7M84_015640 [Penaeus vannamei]
MLFVFLVHHLTEDHVTSSSSLTIRYLDRNAIKEKGRYKGLYLPYIVFPLVGEMLHEGKVKEIYSTVERHFPALGVQIPAAVVKDYRASGEGPPGDAFANRTLAKIGDFFDYLRHPRLRCGKLKRMGGTYNCNGQGDLNGMDGHKYVCMDPSLELGGTKDPAGCLTLSYGVHTDASFDEGVAELPCEVHMFDVLNYDPLLAKEVEHVHFHLEGLAYKPSATYYNNLNITAHMDNILGHILKYNLDPRPINILKIDIEGNEWDALADAAKGGQKILELVGQIAIELHNVDLVQGLNYHWLDSKSPDQWLKVLQKRFDILMGLEDMGFRPPVYWKPHPNTHTLTPLLLPSPRTVLEQPPTHHTPNHPSSSFSPETWVSGPRVLGQPPPNTTP